MLKLIKKKKRYIAPLSTRYCYRYRSCLRPIICFGRGKKISFYFLPPTRTIYQTKTKPISIWVMGRSLSYQTTKIFTLITEESFLDLDLCTIAKYGKLTNIGALSFISNTSMSTMTWATLGLMPLPASLRTSITSSYLSWTSRSNGIPEIKKPIYLKKCQKVVTVAKWYTCKEIPRTFCFICILVLIAYGGK